MHGFYRETIQICKEAKEHNKSGHDTHRHWAFAEYKEGNIVRAIKKIRKAAHLAPHLAENWIVWGLILRTAGKYRSAYHKFERALILDPNNSTAIFELDLVSQMIYFDSILPQDATLEIAPLAIKRDSPDDPLPVAAPQSLCLIF